MAEVVIPGFRYSGFYFAELLQDLLIWRRANVPELTDEDPNEPLIQMLRAYALVGHLTNSLLDHVALETLLPTARLRESVRGHLKLIGYQLKQPTPAVADMLLKLAAVLTAQGTIPAKSIFTTVPTDTKPEILYETGPSSPVGPTDLLTAGFEQLASTGVFTDRTTILNTGVGSFQPWGGVAHVGDALYFAHASIIWDRIDITHTTAGAIWGVNDHVWEYFDGQLDDTTPTAVTILASTLKFDLTSLLGTNNRAGASVQVRANTTGKAETVTSTWSGTTNEATTTFLGQSTPSGTITSYVIGTQWKEPENIVETVSGDVRTVKYTIPENTKRKWQLTTVNALNYFWKRLRIINLTTPSPTFTRGRIDLGKQYFKTVTTQGKSFRDDPAGTSTGLADQVFVTARRDVIEGTVKLFVNEGGAGYVEWTKVDDFLSSASTSRHFTVDFDDKGRASCTLGNGTNGKVPTTGDVIALDYRQGAEEDGNVGADTITVNRGSVAVVASVTNPRAATGWKPADGATDVDLARVKVAGPATLKTLDRALSVEDIETLTLSFKASTGASPVARAKGVEDAFGPKTVKIVVVGAGGAAVPNEFLTEIDVFFNGKVVENKPGKLVLNTKATAANYIQKSIAVTATVRGASASQTKIIAALQAFLSPLATEADGSYVHAVAGIVYRSRIIGEIFKADPNYVDDVTLTTPAADVDLVTDELPVAGTISITITT